MPSFNTVPQMLKFILNDIEDALMQQVNLEMQEILRQKISSNVYSRGSSYDRTYTLLNSVDSKLYRDGSYNINVDVWNNEKLMQLTTYPSWTGGSTDNRDMIVEWVNDGHGMSGNTGDLAPQPATNFIEDARSTINNSLDKLLMTALKRIGVRMVK